jgi:DNA-binding NarL/FixJ family response regulator
VYPFTTGLVVKAPQLRDEVLTALHEMPSRLVQDQAQIGEIAAFVRSVEQNRPDVLLVDVTGLKETLDPLARALKESSARPLLIALHETADPDLILRAMRLGFQEYLYSPLAGTLRPARARKQAAAAGALSASFRPRVVAEPLPSPATWLTNCGARAPSKFYWRISTSTPEWCTSL